MAGAVLKKRMIVLTQVVTYYSTPMHPYHTIILFLGLSCTFSAKAPSPTAVAAAAPADSIPTPIFPKPDRAYPASRALVEKQRKALKAAYAAGLISLDSVGQAFTNCLLTEIVPHWYGTTWAFEGHTETPGQGQIACGYFVSTTLLHTGLNLNRYRLAQQGPADEALMLSQGDTVRVVRRSGAAQAMALWREQLRDGLYFIGLDAMHVGYLLKLGARLYFLHSNYAQPYQVQLQRAEESVLMGFSTFYLADITFNGRLMEYWLNGEKVPLINNGILAEQQK